MLLFTPQNPSFSIFPPVSTSLHVRPPAAQPLFWGHFPPGARAGPASCTSCIHTSPAPTHWSQVTRAQVQRPPPSPRVLPHSPLPRPSSRSRRRHARAPAGPRSLASPTPPLGNSPALLSKPPSQRAHLSTRARGLPRARTTHTCTRLTTRACPSPRARARTSPHRCTHFHTRAHHLPSPAAQHSPRGARSDGAQPLPRSLRSKNSAASSRRCTLIIRTRSMGSALPPPADRRRHRRLQSHDTPGHVRRAGGPARPRLGALSAAPAVPAAPAA